MTQTRGSQKLTNFIAHIPGEFPFRAFSRLLMAAARKHPLIRAPRNLVPSHEIRRWAEGKAKPSQSTQDLIQMATGGTLTRPSSRHVAAWTITGGDVTPEDWAVVVEEGVVTG